MSAFKWHEELMDDARRAVAKNPNLRFGQALYNAAYRRYPAAAKLANTPVDPYHDDSRIADFLEALQTKKEESQ